MHSRGQRLTLSILARRIVRIALAAAGLVAIACSGSFRPPPPAAQTPDPAAWSPEDLTVAYLGHASVLIDFAGTMILTDPTLYDRIGPAVGPLTIGPKRVVASALPAERLPKLDALLVTHAHMDSLDCPSLERLAATPLLVVPERTRDLVDDLGYSRVVELAWGKQAAAGDVTIEAVPVRHWARRWPWESWRGYNGYLLSRGGVRVLFASDTAYSPELAEWARSRHVTVAILGIGAYDPWIWNHEDPEQAWQTFAQSGAQHLIPVHWDTFRLGKEPLGDAMRRLLAAAGADRARIVIREIGSTWALRLDATR
jgi:L-ascorbate metabolism protein UlaG (beta-lactamase superfamily)